MVAWLSNQVYVHGINYVKASDNLSSQLGRASACQGEVYHIPI